MCSSTDLCGQLLQAVLLDANKHPTFCKWELWSINHILRHVRQIFSSDIVRSLHLSVKPLIVYVSITPKHWFKHAKSEFFPLVINTCTTPHVEQTKKTNQTYHTYRYRTQVLLISKEIHPVQKIRCKSKILKLMRCTQPLSYNASLYLDRLPEILFRHVRHMFSQDHGELSDSVNEWREEAQ